MARDTSRGLHVWDLGTDQFDHVALAANWDRIETILAAGAQSIETVSTLPITNLFTGRLVMLSAANSGFAAWSLMVYTGTTWFPVSGTEILPAVPTTGNFAGRVVVLSAANSGFNAWDVIRYDGSSWSIVGGWASVNTGSGLTHISGVVTQGDVYLNDQNRGVILKDRSTGILRRVYIDNGYLMTEVVT